MSINSKISRRCSSHLLNFVELEHPAQVRKQLRRRPQCTLLVLWCFNGKTQNRREVGFGDEHLAFLNEKLALQGKQEGTLANILSGYFVINLYSHQELRQGHASRFIKIICQIGHITTKYSQSSAI